MRRKIYTSLPLLAPSFLNYAVCEQQGVSERSKSKVSNKPVYRIVVCGEGEAASAANSELLRIVANSPTTPYEIRISQILPRDLAISVPAIDLNGKSIRLQSGQQVSYEQCILAFDRPLSPLLDKMINKDLLSRQGHSYAVIRDSRNALDLEFAAKIISMGGHVTILGANNWSNIEAACYLATIAQENGFSRSVSLVYPSYGPMSGLLPRYLSLLLASRLVSKGVELVPFSQVKYIDSFVQRKTREPNSSEPKQEMTASMPSINAATIYIARSYDSIHSTSFPTDVIFLGPSTITGEWVDQFQQQELRVMAREHSLVQALLTSQDLEIDRLLGGLPLNRSLQVAQGLLVAGECANVFHSQLSAGNQHNSTLSYRHLVSGEYDARHIARSAAAIALGQARVYDKVPCEVLHSPEVGISFLSVGLCTAALESHSYWWKQPIATNQAKMNSSARTARKEINASSNKITKTNDGQELPENKPVLSEYLKKDFTKAIAGGPGSGDHSNSINDSNISTGTQNLGPKGKIAVHQTGGTKQTIDKRQLVSWTDKQTPLGTGVTLYVDQFRVVGVLLTGLPLGQLYDNQRMNDGKIQHIENVVCKYIGKTLLSKDQQHALSEGQDFDRFGMAQLLENTAEDILKDVGQQMDAMLLQNANSSKKEENSQSFSYFYNNKITKHEKPHQPTLRKLYRFGPASRVSIMEQNEHMNRQMTGRIPASLTEPLFAVKVNTGSRADRLAAAYAQHIIHAVNATSPYEASLGPNHNASGKK